jgi:hypothetical protein
MDIEPLKNAFWAIVADCLHLFHGMSRVEAEASVGSNRGRLEQSLPFACQPTAWESELFYHGEPFYVACDIAGRELEIGPFHDRYEAMQEWHYSAAERAAFAPVFRRAPFRAAAG